MNLFVAICLCILTGTIGFVCGEIDDIYKLIDSKWKQDILSIGE